MQSYLACGSTVAVWEYVMAKSSSNSSICLDTSEINKEIEQRYDSATEGLLYSYTIVFMVHHGTVMNFKEVLP